MIRILPVLFLVSACGSSPAGAPPDFALEDVNPSSASFGERVGPADFEGEISAWYFGWATCPICQGHVAELDTMQSELSQAETAVPITIVGINQVGRESGNPDITEGVDLPWLQDTVEHDVFGHWPPSTIRELKIVGTDGQVVQSIDLNAEDPREDGPYQAIKQALVDAANADQAAVPE